MTEEEYIHRIKSEILNGETILEEFKSLSALRNAFGDGAAVFCAPMLPSYDQDTRMKIESVLYAW